MVYYTNGTTEKINIEPNGEKTVKIKSKDGKKIITIFPNNSTQTVSVNDNGTSTTKIVQPDGSSSTLVIPYVPEVEDSREEEKAKDALSK